MNNNNNPTGKDLYNLYYKHMLSQNVYAIEWEELGGVKRRAWDRAVEDFISKQEGIVHHA